MKQRERKDSRYSPDCHPQEKCESLQASSCRSLGVGIRATVTRLSATLGLPRNVAGDTLALFGPMGDRGWLIWFGH